MSDAPCRQALPKILPTIPAEDRLDLAGRQRLLLAMLKGRLVPGSPDEKAALRLYGDRELAMLREVALWWRKLGIMRACRFTPALLDRQGRLDDAIRDFVRSSAGSDFIDRQGELFLIHAMTDTSPGGAGDGGDRGGAAALDARSGGARRRHRLAGRSGGGVREPWPKARRSIPPRLSAPSSWSSGAASRAVIAWRRTSDSSIFA